MEDMNWLLIAPENKSENLSKAKDFLLKHDVSPFEIILHESMSKDELYDCLKHILQTTHCIILGSYWMKSNADYIFLYGALCGKKVKTFVYSGMEVPPGEKCFELIDNDPNALTNVYTNLSELFSMIEGKFDAFISADKQHQSLVQLFTLGIPFTSDCFAQFIAKDDTDTCDIFHSAGMSVNVRTTDGVPLICVATRNDCEHKVRWLVENGADINEKSLDRGYSAVMDAVWRKNYEITKYLVDQGAELNYITSDGQPILVLAVGNGSVKIVELLLENGADPDIRDSMGMSAREYANLFKKPGMVALMERFPSKS